MVHAGYDFPWMLQNTIPGNLWGGSRRHDEHHQKSSPYYQKFFTYLDYLLEQAVRTRSRHAHRPQRDRGQGVTAQT